jgi:hypothetical protein
MRKLVLGGLLVLTGCGGGGTTGTNYSDPPPMAEIVATPSPQASEGAQAEETDTSAVMANTMQVDSGTDNTVEPSENAM